MNASRRGMFFGGNRLLEPSARDRIRLAWRLLRDERVTAMKYALPALLLVYLVSPLDFIPDLLLGIGQADDVGIAIAAVLVMTRIIPKLAPAHVVDDHLRDMGMAGQGFEPRAEDSSQVIDARFSVR